VKKKKKYPSKLVVAASSESGIVRDKRLGVRLDLKKMRLMGPNLARYGLPEKDWGA
jgi:hypothetical protein